MLGIPERAVRDRAHAALALLAPRQARELTAPQREEIGEYLLGRQTPARALATRALLERSAPARGWALALADELAPLAVEPLPSIPERPRRAGAGRGLPAPGPGARSCWARSRRSRSRGSC